MDETNEELIQRKRLKSETDFSRNASMALDGVLREIVVAVNGYFRKNRRLKGGDLKGLFDSVDALVREGTVAVRSRFDVREPTKARKKSEAYEAMYVVVNNQESDSEMRNRVFRLHAVRVFGTRKKIVVEISPLDVAFSRHAASRLYERGMNVDQAVETLGSFLHDWSIVPALGEWALGEAGAVRLSVPGPSGGLLLGYIDGTAAVPVGSLTTFDATGGRTQSIPACPTSPGLYIVNTFVAHADLREEQSELRQCLGLWRTACGRGYDTALDDMTWKRREIAPSDGAEFEPSKVAALELLVRHPKALSAMGNGRADREALMETEGTSEEEAVIQPSP